MSNSQSVTKTKRPFFWVDLEMTGLDEAVDSILEVAIALTDTELNVIEQYQKVVFQPQNVIDGMNDWCKKTHGQSGLTAAIPNGTPLAQVEKEVLALIEGHYSRNERIVLCGNSVGNDRRFIDKYMPTLAQRLHYRLIDVSSFKEVYRDIYGLSFQKKNAHRATDDILESINELKFYLSFVKVPVTPATTTTTTPS
ncbi:MAG: oligoribonuclease [Oligoflexia bacterium]|nr:oligoribonuclease [Oligoflexia bacterium]